jgi:hypothetical protein
MDELKRRQLIDRLAKMPEPQIVPIADFFDGNDDLGSIGCNLPDHPGIDAFRTTLTSIAKRPDVEAVYAEIFELDPGEGCWPFTDTIYVLGAIAQDTLETLVAHLEPDTVSPADPEYLPLTLQNVKKPLLIIWWD